MAVKAIAHVYYRCIKAGTRTFDSVPSSVKEDIRILAKLDVQNGIITAEEYETLLGEDYTE